MHPGDESVVANAFFAAVDEAGKISVKVINIDFDLQLFDSASIVKMLHETIDIRADHSFAVGLDEIEQEFRSTTTQRAKDYMAWFKRRIATFPRDQQNAELASKYVELSILLHPRNSELAFPVDVLQLRADGAHWVWLKSSCPSN
jgi:hypothetical protein